jgi:lipoprotein NlpI
LNPTLSEAYFDRGMAHYYLGHTHKALIDLQQAAQFFQHQDKTVAYARTLDLIEQIRQSPDSRVAGNSSYFSVLRIGSFSV